MLHLSDQTWRCFLRVLGTDRGADALPSLAEGMPPPQGYISSAMPDLIRRCERSAPCGAAAFTGHPEDVWPTRCWVGVEATQRFSILLYTELRAELGSIQALMLKQQESSFVLAPQKPGVLSMPRGSLWDRWRVTVISGSLHPKIGVSKVDGTTHPLLLSFHRLEKKLRYHVRTRYPVLRKLTSAEKNPDQKTILRQG